MRIALYILIFLGTVLLGFDLAKQVEMIELVAKKATAQAPPEKTKTPANPHENGHPDIAEALRQYTAAIDAAPDQAKPYVDRANAYIANRQLPEAVADFDRAIAIEPSNTSYLAQRGYMLVNLEQSDKAIADFTKAIEIDPSYTKARIYRAITHYRNQQFQPALDDCLVILKNDPSFTDLHITIAQCYYGIEKKDLALEHLQLYLDRTSDPQGKQEAEALKKEWASTPTAQ